MVEKYTLVKTNKIISKIYILAHTINLFFYLLNKSYMETKN